MTAAEIVVRAFIFTHEPDAHRHHGQEVQYQHSEVDWAKIFLRLLQRQLPHLASAHTRLDLAAGHDDMLTPLHGRRGHVIGHQWPGIDPRIRNGVVCPSAFREAFMIFFICPIIQDFFDTFAIRIAHYKQMRLSGRHCRTGHDRLGRRRPFAPCLRTSTPVPCRTKLIHVT